LKSLGDLRILTATDDSMSDVVFIDKINLTGEVGAYNGREVVFTGGTEANLGEIRYVNASQATARNIQFSISLPALVAAGDECEMFNTRGTGFHIQDVHDAINQSIRSIGGTSYLETAATNDAAYTYGTPIQLPTEFVTVEDVQWQDPNDSAWFRTIPKSPKPNGKGWWVDKASRTLNITGKLAALNYNWGNGDSRTVRVWGLAEPAELHDDDDVTTINAAWLTANTIAILLRSRYFRMPTPETERLMYDAIQDARNLTPRATVRRGPFSESLQ